MENNYAQFNGGSIFMKDKSFLNFENGMIVFNKAKNGGGIYVEVGSTIKLSKMNIINNTATLNGGAIYCSDSNLNITKSQFQNNKDNLAESNIFCSNKPSYTWCNLYSDENFSTQCGEPHYSSDNIKYLPPLLIIILASTSVMVIIIIIISIVCYSWRKKYQKKKYLDNLELLSDYDDYD